MQHLSKPPDAAYIRAAPACKTFLLYPMPDDLQLQFCDGKPAHLPATITNAHTTTSAAHAKTTCHGRTIAPRHPAHIPKPHAAGCIMRPRIGLPHTLRHPYTTAPHTATRDTIAPQATCPGA